MSELWGQNGGKRESSSFSKGISHKQQKLKRKSPVCIMWSFKERTTFARIQSDGWKKLFLEFQILIDDRRKLDNLSLNFHKGEKLIWKIPHRSWVTPSADISTFEPLLNVEKWWIPFSIEQMTPFPLKNFMKKKDANLQNQYYGGIVTWIYTLKLGEVVRGETNGGLPQTMTSP